MLCTPNGFAATQLARPAQLFAWPRRRGKWRCWEHVNPNKKAIRRVPRHPGEPIAGRACKTVSTNCGSWPAEGVSVDTSSADRTEDRSYGRWFKRNPVQMLLAEAEQGERDTIAGQDEGGKGLVAGGAARPRTDGCLRCMMEFCTLMGQCRGDGTWGWRVTRSVVVFLQTQMTMAMGRNQGDAGWRRGHLGR